LFSWFLFCFVFVVVIQATWPAASHACDLLHGVDVNKKGLPIGQSDQSRKRPLEGSPSATSVPSQPQTQTRTHSHSDPGSPTQESTTTNDLSMFHPSQFMELTHSLGLDPSGLNSVFDAPTYGTWLSNDMAFTGLQGDVVRSSTMLLGHKDPG
jgi:hypothetical protein